MTKPSTPDIWASSKTFGFQPSSAQQAQGFDYIANVRPTTGAPITDDHDWPLNQITSALKWVMDQIPNAGLKQAAFRDVGVSAGQLPAIEDFIMSSGTGFGRVRLPNGFMIQWKTVTVPQSSGLNPGTISSTFPIPFTTSVFGCWINYNGISATPANKPFLSVLATSLSAFTAASGYEVSGMPSTVFAIGV